MSCVGRFACGKTSSNNRVDAALMHYLLEAPLERGAQEVAGGRTGHGLRRREVPERRERQRADRHRRARVEGLPQVNGIMW